MKSSEAAVRILLDTSFLLPSLGISVSGAAQEGIRNLAEASVDVHYSRFSILESLWVAARTVRDTNFDAEGLGPGLRSIMEGGRYGKVEEDSEIFGEAFELYGLGHKDMIDNVLYAAAARLGLRLLTLDDELREFTVEKRLKDVFISVEELAALARMLREEKSNRSSQPAQERSSEPGTRRTPATGQRGNSPRKAA